MSRLRLKPANRSLVAGVLRVVMVIAAGTLTISGLDIVTLHADQLVTPHATVVRVAAPRPTPLATAATIPAGNFSAVLTANVNLHSTPVATSSNYVLTAWQGRPVTVLSTTNTDWYYVSYATTDGQTVTGYLLRVLTSRP